MAVNAFKQAFLSDNEQGVLQYSSAASQNIEINQLNTAYQSLTIKSISGVDTQVEIVLVGITNSGVSKNIAWGFVKENGVWKFDLGITEQLSQQI
jgi:VCBS repeat-containing protein